MRMCVRESRGLKKGYLLNISDLTSPTQGNAMELLSHQSRVSSIGCHFALLVRKWTFLNFLEQ